MSDPRTTSPPPIESQPVEFSPEFDRAAWMSLGLAFAIVIQCLGSIRMIPGGPFVSLFGDILPSILCVAILICGVLTLRSATPGVRVWILGVVLLTTLFLGSVVAGVVTFWLDPHARGALFGL